MNLHIVHGTLLLDIFVHVDKIDGYNPLTIFLLKISNFIPPPPSPSTTVSSCLTTAGGSKPAGQLPEVS